MVSVRTLALFDLDGTITFADTFTPFLYHAVEPRRVAQGKVLLSPLVVLYKLRLLPATTMRKMAVWFGLRGRRADDVRAAGLEYARAHLPRVVRPKALARIRWHQAQGDDVAVVSASLDVYLQPWCTSLGLQLIATQLAESDGVLSGRYRDGDCSGQEKARRIASLYPLSQYGAVYAYGDTREDEAMLRLATHPYYRWSELID